MPPPSYIEDGKPHCPVAYDAVEGVWETGGVLATLVTHVPDFRQKTTVLWLKFDKLGDADDWIYTFRIESAVVPPGEPGSENNPANALSWRSGWSTFNSTIRNQYGYSTHCWPFGINNSGPVVQEGRLLKIAEVLTDKLDGTFDVDYYWDPYDGGGLRRYGGTVNIEEGYVCPYGNPATGDFIEFMAGVANLTGDTAGVTFEEARIYDGVMTAEEIGDLTYAGEPILIGHWTFDSSGGSSPVSNKAPGFTWDPLSLNGTGAAVADGKLILPRYQSGGSWVQSNATTMLKTDLGVGGYSKEITLVAWLKWPGFNTAGDWARLVSLGKFSTATHDAGNEKALQSIVMKATDDNFNWGSDRKWEYLDGGLQIGSQSLACGGSDPPTDILIKLAQVVTAKLDGNYELRTYWDIGAGLVQVGATQTIAAADINAFGQYDTDCLVDPTGGKRYDGLGLMDICQSVPQSAGEISFEEVRLYAGSMDAADIAALSYVPLPPPRLVGHWTFDEYAGTHVLADKTPGVEWTQLTFVGAGASVTDGKLILPRYQDGTTWKQTGATCMLRTDLGESGYFKEMTQIAWLYWPGFDTAADWARLTSVVKCPTSTYEQWNTKAAQGMVMKATDDAFNWGGHRAWEYLDGGVVQTTSTWLSCGGSDPPTDRFIKVALVVKQLDENTFEQSMYWDTGSGLAQIGSARTIPASQVNAFGQYDTDCLIDPSGGKRYDGFGIMDVALSVPQSAGQIVFEEVRLYASAMTPAEIAATTPVHAALGDMVGHWTFDNYLGTGPLESKVPGITWETLSLTPASGAGVADGKLILPRYLSGSWKQSAAWTRLKTDLGASGYFRQMSLVAWIKWPGFDTASIWQRMMVLIKCSAAYNPLNMAYTRAAQSIVMKSTDNTNWTAHRVYEKDVSPFYAAQWANHFGSDPPTDRYIKIAQVLRYVDVTKYQQEMYWDIGDGNGLVQIGAPVPVWTTTQPHWLDAFGQYGTDSIKYPGAGNRYDAFAFMDYAWSAPQSEGEIVFEEARLYRGALTAAQIDALQYIGQGEPPKPVVGASGKSLLDPIMDAADWQYRWVLWGAVTFIDDDSFSINDGSGVEVTVIAPGHGLSGGEYVRVQGTLDAGATPKTLTANDISVVN